MMNTLHKGASIVCIAVLSQYAGGTQASEVTTDATDASTDSLTEVVVTARRREEKLQDVPLAISVISADEIRNSGAVDLRAIIAQTPGVTIDESAAEAFAVPVIRGQYNLNNGPGSGGQPNVAIFVDGVYLQNVNAITIGLMDLERVEIVKGPVSALYGRNGFAGAINYVSKVPTDQFHSTGYVDIAERGDTVAAGDVNGPLVPGLLRAGLAVNYENNDGPYVDGVTGRRAGAFDKHDFKATFDLTPSNDLDVRGGFYYGDDKFGQQTLVYAAPNCAFGTYYCGQYTPNPIEVSNLPAGAGDAPNNRLVQNANLKLDYNLGWGDVSYLGGYDNVIERAYSDFTGLRDGLTFELNPGPGTANVFELFGADDNTKDFQHELRLSSKQTTSLRWSVGADYYESTNLDTTLIGIDGSQIPAGQSVSSAANFFLAGLFVTPFGQPSTSNFTETLTKEKQYSFFGSADYDLLDSLTASGEVRNTHDQQQLYIMRNSFVANVVNPFGFVPGIGAGFTNYRASLKYKFTPKAMVYASVATGTKAGGYNSRATISSELSYKPENNTTYEVGAKLAFLDSKLLFDAAIYHITSTDLQINGLSADPKNIGQVTKNFGGTTNTGFELSATYQPVRKLTLGAGIAYADPKFDNGTNDVNGVFYCSIQCPGRIITIQTAQGPKQSVNLDGLQLERSSKITANLSAEFRHSLGGDYEAFYRADYRYETKEYVGLEDLYYTGSRSLLNLRAGFGEGVFTVAAFLKNATNNRTPIYPTQATELNNLGSEFLGNLPAPRTLGVEFGYKL
jgi:outer membrane receptor protein involved in Fe transport